jgi:hypothetical protein
MPFIPVPQTGQFNIRATYFGIEVENVLNFFHIGGPISPALLASGAAVLAAQWASGVMQNLSVSYILREIHAVDLSSASGAIATDTSEAGATGALLDTPGLPGNIAFCVSFRTAFRGRSFRGRTYLCGLTESRVTENLVPLSWANAVIEDFDNLSAAMTTEGWTLSVVSRFTGGAPRVEGIHTPVSNILFTDLRVDTQRRRLE